MPLWGRKIKDRKIFKNFEKDKLPTREIFEKKYATYTDNQKEPFVADEIIIKTLEKRILDKGMSNFNKVYMINDTSVLKISNRNQVEYFFILEYLGTIYQQTLQTSCNCENIVEIYEIGYFTDNYGKLRFYSIQEYGGKKLPQTRQPDWSGSWREPDPEIQKWLKTYCNQILKDILKALKCLYDNNYSYNDIRFGNIVYTQKNDTVTAKLIDFEFVRQTKHLSGENTDTLIRYKDDGSLGLLIYNSPEITASYPNYYNEPGVEISRESGPIMEATPKTILHDLWALGVIYSEMIYISFINQFDWVRVLGIILTMDEKQYSNEKKIIYTLMGLDQDICNDKEYLDAIDDFKNAYNKYVTIAYMRYNNRKEYKDNKKQNKIQKVESYNQMQEKYTEFVKKYIELCYGTDDKDGEDGFAKKIFKQMKILLPDSSTSTTSSGGSILKSRKSRKKSRKKKSRKSKRKKTRKSKRKKSRNKKSKRK